MGYTSDIRFLVPKADYAKIKGDCQVKYGDISYFNYVNKEEIRKDSDGNEFMYFGWDCVKWYAKTGDGDCDEIDDIENAVSELEQYQKVRIGENYDDIEEFFNLGDTDVDYIDVLREFDEYPNKNIVYVVMIRDVSDFGNTDGAFINECAVFTTRENARVHLKAVVEGYKADAIKESLESDDVGFDEKAAKEYVMVETEDSFTYYAQGYYNTNHIEAWIVETEIDSLNQGGKKL